MDPGSQGPRRGPARSIQHPGTADGQPRSRTAQAPSGSPLWDRRMDLLRQGGEGCGLCEHWADSGPCLQFTRPLVAAEKNTLFRRCVCSGVSRGLRATFGVLYLQGPILRSHSRRCSLGRAVGFWAALDLPGGGRCHMTSSRLSPTSWVCGACQGRLMTAALPRLAHPGPGRRG